MNWFEKLIGAVGYERAVGASKHQRGKRKPRGWKQIKKLTRKRAKLARRQSR